MKLKYKKDPDSSVAVTVDSITKPYLDMNWHYHNSIELTYIVDGSGILVVGDKIVNFSSNQLFLIGSRLPHIFINNINDNSVTNMVVIKFFYSPSNIDIYKLPVFSKINYLLIDAQKGILFDTEVVNKLAPFISEIQMSSQNDLQFILLLQILQQLSCSNKYTTITDFSSKDISQIESDNRITRIIDYIYENYDKNLKLSDIANAASTVSTSLCRFFKERTGRTIFNFINSIRIDKACILLIDNNYQISEICFMCGFNSISTFNRIFKQFKGIAPSAFRIKYLQNKDSIKSIVL